MTTFNIVFLAVLLVVVATIVVSVARGRPKQPPHRPGSLMASYKRGGRGYTAFVQRRIRSGRFGKR